jgi:hypothetical protein
VVTRIGDSPATPSRWIHRLQMILNAGLKKHLRHLALARNGAQACRAEGGDARRHAEAPPARGAQAQGR